MTSLSSPTGDLLADPPGNLLSARPQLVVAVLVLAVLAGIAVVPFGLYVVLVVGALMILVLCAIHPAAAVYLYLGTLPFLAGIDRDALLPLVRPNEAVLVLVMAGAIVGGYVRYARGTDLQLRFHPVDGPLAVFVLTATLWPPASLMLRGHVPDSSDLAALLPIVKLVGLLVLVRVAISTGAQVLCVIRIVMWTATVIAVIAVLQTLEFSPVLQLLGRWWAAGLDPADLAERGSTTLASPIATGDCLVVALALLACATVRGLLTRAERCVIAPLLVAGIMATGQFSAWLAAATVAAVLLRESPRHRRIALRAAPWLAVAALAGAPAFFIRISQVGGEFGVPRSWLGRWDNLTNFYLPQLGEFHFVLGVSPNSVLQAPETWREVIYLEFGYLQLLWVGGIPLLIAFAWFAHAVLQTTSTVRTRTDVVGACASVLHAVEQ